MPHANEARHLVLAAVCALSIVACGDAHESSPDTNGTAAPAADSITKEELTTYLDWAVEVKDQMLAGMAEARRKMDDNQALVEMFERRREEQIAILAREPFKGTLKAQAIRGVIDTLYDSGTFVRDQNKLEKLRARDGKDLIDSILAHERLIREKLDPDGLHVGARELGRSR